MAASYTNLPGRLRGRCLIHLCVSTAPPEQHKPFEAISTAKDAPCHDLLVVLGQTDNEQVQAAISVHSGS